MCYASLDPALPISRINCRFAGNLTFTTGFASLLRLAAWLSLRTTLQLPIAGCRWSNVGNWWFVLLISVYISMIWHRCVSFSYDCLCLNVIMEMWIVGWMCHERQFNRFSRVNFSDERSSESRGCWSFQGTRRRSARLFQLTTAMVCTRKNSWKMQARN